MDPGPNVVSSSPAGKKKKVGLTPSPLFTRHLCAIDPSRVGVGNGAVGPGDEERMVGPPDCAVVAYPLWAWEQVLSEVSCECLHQFLRESHWEHSTLLRCGEFSFFQFWLLLPQSWCSQALLVGLRWSSREECKWSSCQLTPSDLSLHSDVFCPNHRPLSASKSPLLCCQRFSEEKPDTQTPVCYLPPSMDDADRALQISQGSPSWDEREHLPSFGVQGLTAQLFLKRSISEVPFLSNEFSLLYLWKWVSRLKAGNLFFPSTWTFLEVYPSSNSLCVSDTCPFGVWMKISFPLT